MLRGGLRRLYGSPRRAILAVTAVAAAVWWQWPLITHQAARTDVVLVTDSFLTTTERPVTYRIHEDGRSVRWDQQASSWCDAAAAVRDAAARYDPAAFVLSFAGSTGCDASSVVDAVRAAAGHRVVIVTQPGRSGVEPTGASAGAMVVDPSTFVGSTPQPTELPCQWWETCPPGGTIAVRGADGSLTQEGGDRVARIIVAALP